MAKAKRSDGCISRILSLDGGGIRGVMSAVWLARLEERTDRKVNELFDLVAGTSTGGILACAVGLGVPASDIIKLYKERGREIFPSAASRMWNRLGRTLSQGPSAPKYSDAGLERVLQSVFGDAVFGDIRVKPTLITAYNTLTRQALVFKNTKPEHSQLRVWQIAKATASAPTYFPAAMLRIQGADAPLIDGGVVANNPTACAIAEAVRRNGDAKTGKGLSDLTVLSLGTGHTTRPISLSEAREWGALEWAVPVIDVLMDGTADATEYIAKQLLPAERYFRFQAVLDKAFDDMDDASQTNINALMNIANDYLSTGGGDDDIKAIAKLL